ncbi:MAG: 1-acyl-sn-glycerol-3-phosphate acyltransferase [Marinospirillum sp.]|uniref:lysophospholipid acyltransferase family protein n=1 Tax=Marinospirillum sp. TaxID=2183934 RepID=UPI001A023973|nr:lysophospholipid acyltransferase family protein [Marinospirillum sp.]MBE0505653.1 1-acyl-sn-glycerol-3-phosphate acyltransferase [Marinospirillum sp.]
MTQPKPRKPRPLGSLLFYFGYFSALLVIGAPMALLSIPLPLRQRFSLLNIYNRFVLFWLRITCGIEYRFSGLENLASPPYVMVANHQSEWETIILHTLRPPLCTVLKQELLQIPIFGWGLRLIKPIPLDRSQPAKMLRKVLKVGGERLDEGLSVLIFPEGTRVPPGKRKPFSKSAAMIACKAGVPIIPVAHNGGEHWDPKSWIKLSGTLSLRIGKPINTQGRRADEVMAEAEQWIETQLAEISAVPRPTLATTESDAAPKDATQA